MSDLNLGSDTDPVIASYVEVWENEMRFQKSLSTTVFKPTPVYSRAFKYFYAESSVLDVFLDDNLDDNSGQLPGDARARLEKKTGVLKDYALETSWNMDENLFFNPPFGENEVQKVKGMVENLNRSREKRVIEKIKEIDVSRRETPASAFSDVNFDLYSAISGFINTNFDIKANAIIMGQDVYGFFKNNKSLVGLLGSNKDRISTSEDIAGIFDLDFVEVVTGNLASDFTGKLLIFHANEAEDAPSFLKVFTLSNRGEENPVELINYYTASKWSNPRPGVKGFEFLKLSVSYGIEICSNACGYLLEGIN